LDKKAAKKSLETKVDPWEKPQRGSSPTAAFPGNLKLVIGTKIAPVFSP
jgi:hypothetical protein